MASINLKLRTDYESNWENSQSQSKGNLSKGEFGVSIISDNTDGVNVNEVIVRVGIEDALIPFDNCPIVFKSPINFNTENSKIVLVNNHSKTGFRILMYENSQFIMKNNQEFFSMLNIPENFLTIDEEDKINDGILKWDYGFSKMITQLQDENIITTISEISGGDANNNV